MKLLIYVWKMNSKRQVMGETWSRGTNSRLPFDVNVLLNHSTVNTCLRQISLILAKALSERRQLKRLLKGF